MLLFACFVQSNEIPPSKKLSVRKEPFVKEALFRVRGSDGLNIFTWLPRIMSTCQSPTELACSTVHCLQNKNTVGVFSVFYLISMRWRRVHAPEEIKQITFKIDFQNQEALIPSFIKRLWKVCGRSSC